MVPLLKYTVMRLALFIGALWLLDVLGAGPLGALIGAAVVSLLLSYLLLRGPRTQLADQIADKIEHRHHRPPTPAEEDAALEDATLEDAGRRSTVTATEDDGDDEDDEDDGKVGRTTASGG